jgi:hypothetical protein
LSAFERAGVAYLAGSRNSLKIIIEGKVYYVSVNAIGRALADANFKAYILKLSEPLPKIPQEKRTEEQAEVSA